MNWSSITIDLLKTAGHGVIIDAAQSAAAGGADPVAESIADAVARVRAACAAGNQMDIDTTKVPNSLKSVAIRLALFALMERIEYPLTVDQRETRKNDQAYLLRISGDKTRFEIPDRPAGPAEMQAGTSIDIVTQTPRDDYTRAGLKGLL